MSSSTSTSNNVDQDKNSNDNSTKKVSNSGDDLLLKGACCDVSQSLPIREENTSSDFVPQNPTEKKNSISAATSDGNDSPPLALLPSSASPSPYRSSDTTATAATTAKFKRAPPRKRTPPSATSTNKVHTMATNAATTTMESSSHYQYDNCHQKQHQPTFQKRRRRSSRGNSSLSLLALAIAENKHVVFITGAGLSVQSGIRPFRGDDGLWGEVIWSKATREAFRRNPLQWYNEFWLQHFPPNYSHYEPNPGHEALAELSNLSPPPSLLSPPLSTLLTTTIAKNSNDTADATQQHHQHYHHDFDIHKKADTNSKVIRGCGNNNVRIITQNVDGLHLRTKCHWDYKTNLIEAHGHVGLYKCIPMEDSDTDSDSDDDNDRLVKLGSLRKYRTLLTKRRNSCCKRVSCGACGLARDQCQCDSVVCRSHDDRYCNAPPQSILVPKNDTPSSLSCHHHNNGGCNRKVPICMYEMEQSIPANKLEPCETRDILSSTRPSRDTKPIENTMLPISSSRPAAHQQVALSKLLLAKRSLPTTTFAPLTIPASPKCPSCHRPCPPQALLFDEGYHSHSHYQFIQMESWIANADILVFVGTSFSVTITNVALRHAMERNIPVYNFNLLERLNSTVRLNVENIMGDASETLMELLNVTKEVVERLQQQQQHDASIVN